MVENVTLLVVEGILVSSNISSCNSDNHNCINSSRYTSCRSSFQQNYPKEDLTFSIWVCRCSAFCLSTSPKEENRIPNPTRSFSEMKPSLSKSNVEKYFLTFLFQNSDILLQNITKFQLERVKLDFYLFEFNKFWYLEMSVFLQCA